ncbi:MAG: glycosyltransferase family 2 protein [Candidatus Promineifilaceae bacterium]|nr:glycosyltransferase family 2 protein [Candidatus Promineifilaceae bacterium]
MATKDLSLVIPVYNEEENLRPLKREIGDALDDLGIDYEVIFIDDGSSDNSFKIMKSLHDEDSRVTIIRFRRNHGQTAAFAAGFDHAQGRYVVTLDADRQNDPGDIPKLLARIEEGDCDVVNGWRQNRQDAWLMRKFPSLIANWLIATTSGVHLHDRGCSMRMFRAQVVQEINLYGEMHRFIPELCSFAGFSLAEVEVNHRPRVAGESKYGISRTFRVIVDLFTVLFLRKYSDRPMHLFGNIGIPMGTIGFLIILILGFSKIWAGISGGWEGFHTYQIGERPLLLMGVLLVILGVQFVALGLLAELVVRTYYETQGKTVYHIREIVQDNVITPDR